MEYLTGIAASSSPADDYLGIESDESEAAAPVAAVAAGGGRRDFLASLNQGVGRELLDAYVENRTDENRNALAMHYGLCAQVVARQVHRALTPESRRQVDVGDVEQTAMALLFQLVERFDSSLGIPLSAFLTRRLRYAMIDEYRREGLMVRAGRGGEDRRPRCVPLERGGRTMVIVCGGRGPAGRMEDREARRGMLRELPRECRVFAYYRYVRGMQLWQVAKRLNVTCERAGGIEAMCVETLGKEWGGRVRTDEYIRPRQTGMSAPPKKEPGQAVRKMARSEVLPVELQRTKEFRRWCVRRVPWAYRKLVAYRYLRGRDIEWTAGRLGICPNKARVLDRQARPMLMRVVEEYREGRLAQVA